MKRRQGVPVAWFSPLNVAVACLFLVGLATNPHATFAQADQAQPTPEEPLTIVAAEPAEPAPDDATAPAQAIAPQHVPLVLASPEPNITLSLEELMNVQVTSVAGVQQDLFRTPAAISFITPEAIRRSGHLVLPELLRLAPGFFVGRFNAQSYNVSPRGFNSQGANKNLVLLDGRIAYDPLFSGALWDTLDVVLEDIERIETIRGPGPTLWGANAVNGVININTQNAKFTQGLYTTAALGNNKQVGAVRYGDRLSDDAWFRVWGKYYAHDEFERPGPDSAHDDWSIGRGGFRIDGDGDHNTTWTLDGSLYNTFTKGEDILASDPTAHLTTVRITKDARISGGHLSFRAAQENPEDGDGWSFQTYYDQATRVTNADFQDERHTLFADWRHHFNLNDQHELVWGLNALGHFVATENSTGPTTGMVSDEHRTMLSFSSFLQDTITLKPDTFFAMIGSKLEWNDRTGVEVQPGVRFWWTPDDRQMIWASITRAVRLPSRLEEDGIFPLAHVDTGLAAGGPASGVIVPLSIFGSRDLDAEELMAYEMGYRIQPHERVVAGISLFYNDYDRLITIPAGAVGAFTNDGEGQTYGGELAAAWHVADNWRLSASYSFTKLLITEGPFPNAHEGHPPEHQVTFRSFLDITQDVGFNTLVYYTDTLPAVDADANIRLDLGLTWKATENVELALWGQNLLDSQRQEYQGANENERTVYFQITGRF